MTPQQLAEQPQMRFQQRSFGYDDKHGAYYTRYPLLLYLLQYSCNINNNNNYFYYVPQLLLSLPLLLLLTLLLALLLYMYDRERQTTLH